jgi:DNA-binding response OmpR family regulator
MTQHVAIVDDNEPIIDVYMQILADEGYAPYALRDPSTALRLLCATPPALIILDLRFALPDQGWMLLAEIRHDQLLAQTPVIVCSADFASISKRQHEYQQYEFRVVLKPFGIDELLAAVEASLAPQRLVHSYS